MIAVPDLSTLARMYLDETFTIQEKWKITQMIYGAQNDEYDFHHVSPTNSTCTLSDSHPLPSVPYLSAYSYLHSSLTLTLTLTCLGLTDWFQRRNLNITIG